MKNVSLGLVDNHPLLVEGLVSLFSRVPGFHVVAIGTEAQDIPGIARHQLDVIIAEVSMVGDVFKAIQDAKDIAPNTKIVAFTASTDNDSVTRALKAGASGYVLKRSSAKEFIHAIETVRRGEVFVTESCMSEVILALQNPVARWMEGRGVKLTAREEQVVQHLLIGRTNREIAAALSISEKTVKHYMTVLMQKFHARNRVEAVIAAQKFFESSARADISPPRSPLLFGTRKNHQTSKARIPTREAVRLS